MKRNIPFFILLPLVFSACGDSQVTPASTIIPLATETLIERAENWSIKPFVTDLLPDDGRTISSDGQWIVTSYYTIPPTNSNRIIFISNPEQIIDFTYSLPTPTPQSFTFDSWSPDSTGFVGMYFGETTSGLDYCCGQSIVISNIMDGISQSYTYTWGWFEKPDIYWSWDSSKIGLAFRDKGFWILDRQGNLIKKISLNDISNLIWSKNGVYAINYSRNEQYDRYDWNLYKINLNNDSVVKWIRKFRHENGHN